jgi:hypothetical protein
VFFREILEAELVLLVRFVIVSKRGGDSKEGGGWFGVKVFFREKSKRPMLGSLGHCDKMSQWYFCPYM